MKRKQQSLKKKMRKQTFTLEDYLEQLEQMKNMGSIQDLLGMMPGVDKKALSGVNIDERQFDRIGAIIKSMTPKERNNPDIINASRRKRIAEGSGMKIQDVNNLLKQFEQMKKMMKQFSNPKMMKKTMRGLGGLGGFFR